MTSGKIWAVINDDNEEIYFRFGRVGSRETIAEMSLTPEQLLQIFQYSGIDFYEHQNTTDK